MTHLFYPLANVFDSRNVKKIYILNGFENLDGSGYNLKLFEANCRFSKSMVTL